MYYCEILKQFCGINYKHKDGKFVEYWKTETEEEFIDRVNDFLNSPSVKLINIQWLYDIDEYSLAPLKCIITYFKEET